MTTPQRTAIPDSVRTNGATPNPWWANAVVYQIYPRSFQDTNGDGFGDLKGITSRLGYLADLGVDVLWLSPVYKSPQDDNGYDISDYRDIDPLFGTLADMDELIAKAHERGIKIVMDLVVNHTSDEHAWFQASRNPDDPHADWYWWRPARPGKTPGTPGAEPNEWGSYFGGSAWQYDPERGEYYLHQFSKKQPDLNWENPDVRRAVYDMMNWWLDRGVDGFRMDVITLISKRVDANGKLPGEDGSLIPDLPVGEEGYSNPNPFCADGPRQDEFLAEMRREVFDGRDGFMTVGEAPGISPARNEHITDPANGELDMLFLFEHVDFDCDGVKWKPRPLDLPALKRIMADYQHAVKDRGWTALFDGNHDQPRVVSRWGDDSTEESRVASAKALALTLHMHRGTPYVYQGEELGMTNAHFTSLAQYRDLESLNAYRQRVEEARVQSAESMMAGLAARSRDNARTPMQWDDSRYAGFTAPDAPAEPWIAVNPNRTSINAAAEVHDPDSVFAFYKRLIALRHENPVVAAGDWTPLAPDDPQVYAFARSLDDGDGAHRLLTVVNLSKEPADLPADVVALLPSKGHSPESPLAVDRVVIATGSDAEAVTALASGHLVPWQGFVVRL
ncbi:alpha-glucosidase [Bifidobacterium avesanii]|uniref:Alpha,alpha-phosphotrehalase n=1 Tax=Bifidobacterium avesanii TaxID=1798157 RepID=A0A7K3TIQ8_9BIFI|nr:alpha-glucosidase [Bifidobacterium avesanii]KAB8292060.1 glucohydrolase [Bifidobacterium avesanii]NEG78579.1 alpha,alpha-phosphotrehalase [Bifidobacterium avesanii]